MVVAVIAVATVFPPVLAAAAPAAGTAGTAASTVTVATTATVTQEAITAGVTIAASGPVAWGALIVGASEIDEHKYTYDCWKPILHDRSSEPSNGKQLQEVLNDPRIKSFREVKTNNGCRFLVLQNVWNEEFRVDCVKLANGEIAAHANQI